MDKKKKNDNNDVKKKSVKKNTTKENTSNVDKEILKHEALKRLEKQKEIISKEFGLEPEYFRIEINE